MHFSLSVAIPNVVVPVLEDVVQLALLLPPPLLKVAPLAGAESPMLQLEGRLAASVTVALPAPWAGSGTVRRTTVAAVVAVSAVTMCARARPLEGCPLPAYVHMRQICLAS